MRGAGNVGPRGGGRGDILIIFEVEEDPRFERDGEDCIAKCSSPYPQLVFGADVEVPTVTSSVVLHVPARTESGQVFHLKGAVASCECFRNRRSSHPLAASYARNVDRGRGADSSSDSARFRLLPRAEGERFLVEGERVARRLIRAILDSIDC
jgi:hypothetical protein